MDFGAQLRTVWTHKRGLALSLVVAIVAATLSLYRVSLFPPSLEARDYELAGASTRVLIDTQVSKVTDLKATYVDFASLANRADLLGNLMVSDPVLAYIARNMRISPDDIQGSAPVTANVPRTLVEPRANQAASDLINSPNDYKLQIQANPTVPVLKIYTQAPTVEQAVALANTSIVGLRQYLDETAARRNIPQAARVHLRQFGGAHGGVLNAGIAIQVGLLAFLVFFALTLTLVLAFDRVRHGWRMSGALERPPA